MRLLLLYFALGIIQTITLSHPSGSSRNSNSVGELQEPPSLLKRVLRTSSRWMKLKFIQLFISESDIEYFTEPFIDLCLTTEDIIQAFPPVANADNLKSVFHGGNKEDFIEKLAEYLFGRMLEYLILAVRNYTKELSLDIHKSTIQVLPTSVHQGIFQIIEKRTKNTVSDVSEKMKEILNEEILISCLNVKECSLYVSKALQKLNRKLEKRTAKVNDEVNSRLRSKFKEDLFWNPNSPQNSRL